MQSLSRILAITTLLLMTLTLSGSTSVLAAARSPIVVAQGVVTFTGDPIDWRVYELEADPDNPREAVTAAAGFTFVDNGGLIVLDANSGREALLGAGEASFSNDGDLLVINTEAAEPVSYRRIVLMPDEFTDDESNPAAWESDTFSIVSGKREVELSLAMLSGADDTAAVTAGDDGLGLIMALDTAITVTSPDDSSQIVEPGGYRPLAEDVEITAEESASFAVIRIGPAVRDVTQALPPADEFVDNADDDDEVPVDDGDDSEIPAEGTGTLTLQPQICGMGGSTGGCSNSPDAAFLEITGSGLNGAIYTSQITPNDDGTYTLADLPYGEYLVQNLDFGKGTFEVSGGSVDPDQPNVYIVTISAENPEPVFSLRLLPPTGEGAIAIELYVCPAGLPGSWAQPWFCTVQLEGWDLSLTSDAFDGQLRLIDAPASAVGYTFIGLPVGFAFRLSIDAFPEDYPLVQISPDPLAEGPVRIDLSADYSVQTWRFYAVTTDSADLSGVDSDGDLLSDDFEINVIGTNSLMVDTDGDSVWDSRELETGTDPRDPESFWFG